MSDFTKLAEGIDENSLLFKLFDAKFGEFEKAGATPEYHSKALNKFYGLLDSFDRKLHSKLAKFMYSFIGLINEFIVASSLLYYSSGFKDSFKQKKEASYEYMTHEPLNQKQGRTVVGNFNKTPDGIDMNSMPFKLFYCRYEQFEMQGDTPKYYKKACDKLHENVESLKQSLNDKEKKFLEKVLDELAIYKIASDFLYFSSGLQDSFKLEEESVCEYKKQEI